MKTQRKVLLGIACVVGIMAVYFAWVSRPASGDLAEVNDSCTFPSFTNEQYRALVREAKALIAPRRQEVADGGGNIEQNSRNAPLGDAVATFINRSLSTEETFVRLYAFGRALDGRPGDVAPAPGYQFPGPWVRWTDRDSHDRLLPERRLLVSARFQGPPGLFKYPLRTWILARIFGRRYEEFGLGIAFERRPEAPPAEALAGRYMVEAGAGKGPLIWPLNSIEWGDVRIANRCPDAATFVNRLENVLAREGG
jgi:hypothetical protein